MDFDLSERHEMIKNTAREISEKEYREKQEEWIQDDKTIPREELKNLADLGFTGLTLPEKYGGQELDNLTAVVAIETFQRNLVPSLAEIVHETATGPVRQIDFFGTEDQKERFIPPVCKGESIISIAMTEPEHGSALTDLETTAEKQGDEYVINGRKRWVSGAGESDYYLVFVRVGEEKGWKGLGTIIVDKENSNLEFGKKEETMGIETGIQRDIIFENVHVPEENLLTDAGEFIKNMLAFNVERLGNAAENLGIAQAALDEGVKYSQEREQFGKEIIEFQAIQMKIAKMIEKVEAARLLVYRAAANSGREIADRLESSVAKDFANKIGKEVTELSYQIHGAYGYSKDYPIERLYRDARGWAVAAGTPEMQKIGIVSAYLGRSFSQRE